MNFKLVNQKMASRHAELFWKIITSADEEEEEEKLSCIKVYDPIIKINITNMTKKYDIVRFYSIS